MACCCAYKVARQGIGIFSDVLVGPELASGTLVKALDLHLPGYGFFVMWKADHHREKLIAAFRK
jgi:LysR family transcriptional regulator, glycine cleavage system transcriptional activator